MSSLDSFLQSGSTEYTAMKLGLAPMRLALEALGHPEQAYPSVLIAGSNGKGSVARIVESVLRTAGHRAGLYTSPHLERFNERILIQGQEVSDELLEEVLNRLPADDPRISGLTWFEKATLLVFEIFRREKIEIAVLEVGLGGRLDATNTVEPLVSAITSISKDHAEILGDSLFDIAREKAGVMRPGRPVVLGLMPAELRNFLQKAARQMGAAPCCPSLPKGRVEEFSYSAHEGLSLALHGEHQLGNAAVAIEVLQALKEGGFEWQEEQLKAGLREARNPGRLEWMRIGDRSILLDGAHNEEALQGLVKYWSSVAARPPLPASGHPPPRGGRERSLSPAQTYLIFGMMREKDLRSAVRILGALKARWFFTEIPTERSLKIEDLKKICATENISAEFFGGPQAALERVLELGLNGGTIVGAGSLYLVAELRRRLLALGAVPEVS